jgi:hypothetical protein
MQPNSAWPKFINGGFLQFFWNSTGLIAPESADGFNEIGMPKLAALVTAAAALLGSPFPRERDTRWDALLMASERSDQDLKRIFQGSSNLYAAFGEATEPLSFPAMNQQAWELAETENGSESRHSYAQSLHLAQ